MAIDLTTETLIPLRQAAKHRLFKAKSRNGRALDFTTLWRWALRGIRGVKLETQRVGGTLCTSESAIISFIERLSDPDAESEITPSRARKAYLKAEAELEAAGA
jgi:hypothetical protein